MGRILSASSSIQKRKGAATPNAYEPELALGTAPNVTDEQELIPTGSIVFTILMTLVTGPAPIWLRPI